MYTFSGTCPTEESLPLENCTGPRIGLSGGGLLLLICQVAIEWQVHQIADGEFRLFSWLIPIHRTNCGRCSFKAIEILGK